MSRTYGKSQNKVIKKSTTGDTAIDNALWRLSLVLKEIAESTLEENEEKTPVESTARGRRPHRKTREGGDR